MRLKTIAAAPLLCLIVLLSPKVSDPAMIPHVPTPDPAELELLDQLVDWLTQVPPVADGELHLFGEDDLVAAVRNRPQSFELFRSYNGSEQRHRLVAKLPYGDAIYRAARRHRLDSLLLAAVVEAESQFRSQAVSPRGAMGLAQVMPETGQQFGPADLLNPEENLDVGARYLRALLDQFEGDLPLALAAYNAGPGNVARYGDIPPFRETRAYVSKVLKIYVNHHQEVWSGAPENPLSTIL